MEDLLGLVQFSHDIDSFCIGSDIVDIDNSQSKEVL